VARERRLIPTAEVDPEGDPQLRPLPAEIGRERNGRSGACEAGNLPFVRPTVIDRFRPKACHTLLTITATADVSCSIVGEARSDTGQRSREPAISAVGERRQGRLRTTQANFGEFRLANTLEDAGLPANAAVPAVYLGNPG